MVQKLYTEEELEQLPVKDLVAIYNKMTNKSLVKFESKAQGVSRILKTQTLYSAPVEDEKVYRPKELEVLLNLSAVKIRRKIRQVLGKSQDGTWALTSKDIKKIFGKEV